MQTEQLLLLSGMTDTEHRHLVQMKYKNVVKIEVHFRYSHQSFSHQKFA